ncbi:MAG: GerMN domain-containing protein [Lachnospiraceae bacterium]|nr:GerMN domain-containing protein [Lachnospiraceae bacterium]
MKAKRFRMLMLVLLLILLPVFSAGCAKNEEPKAGAFYIYYKDVSSMNLHPVEGVFDDELGFEDRVSAVFGKMRESSKRSNYLSAIPEKIQILSATLLENNLIFDFSSEYYSLNKYEEILMRAAIVKTFTQIPEVSTVEFRVERQPLVLPQGTIPGAMKSSDFKDVFGLGLNAYTEARVVLYFAGESGDKIRRTVREIYYSNQISIEQCVLQQLIAGPKGEEEGFPVLRNSQKLNSVTVRDGVCHIDFGVDFVSQTMTLPAETIIFAIVDSLTEIPEVTSVRITVDSNSEVFFMDTVDLSKPLYRNLDFIENPQNAPVTETAAPE